MLSIASTTWILWEAPGLLPALAIAPVAKRGLLSALLPPVPAIPKKPLPTTIVVDSTMPCTKVTGRISEPIIIPGPEGTLIGMSWPGSWPIASRGRVPPGADEDFDPEENSIKEDRVEGLVAGQTGGLI